MSRRTEGPCAGACGTYIPGRFGTPARTMCDECAAVVAQWLALPATQRPMVIPFGRRVDGKYVQAGQQT